MSREYEQYLRSSEWQQKRSQRLKIDNFRCQKCGSPIDVQVHHLNYNSIFNEDVYRDLITLCKKCHQKVEQDKTEWMTYQSEQRERQYQQNRKNWKDYNLEFCHAYESLDLSNGGDLNLTNLDTITQAFSEWLDEMHYAKVRPGYTIIRDYFRDIRIKKILRMEKAGAPPEAIMAKGISRAMVTKYYGNPKYAAKVLNESCAKEE